VLLLKLNVTALGTRTSSPTEDLFMHSRYRPLAACSLSLLLTAASCSKNDSTPPPTTKVVAKADPQMKAVLDELTALNGKPIETLSPEEARKQPTPADAVKQLMTKQGMDMTPMPVGNVANRTIPGPGGEIPIRVYTPAGNGPFPVLVYFHGGGFVIATIDTYDSSPRALCNMAKCVVVAVEYRKAPENKFPAAPEDAYAATQWVMNNAKEVNGDPARVAVGGESAGGNLSTVTCLMARDKGGKMPVYQMLVYPVVNNDLDTPSYNANANAKPLNKAMMAWFFGHYTRNQSDGMNPYACPMKADLKGLPPATVITDEIDPLMSEGKMYADKLEAAGVKVQYRNYEGVTHEFFGMGAVVDKAKDAEKFAAEGLMSAFKT
jgi:acetyl esterase